MADRAFQAKHRRCLAEYLQKTETARAKLQSVPSRAEGGKIVTVKRGRGTENKVRLTDCGPRESSNSFLISLSH